MKKESGKTEYTLADFVDVTNAEHADRVIVDRIRDLDRRVVRKPEQGAVAADVSVLTWRKLVQDGIVPAERKARRGVAVLALRAPEIQTVAQLLMVACGQ